MNNSIPIIIAATLTLLLISAVGIALADTPISISGVVTPSSGNEGNATGTFSISGNSPATGNRGTFTGTASLNAEGPGLGPVNDKNIVDAPIQGQFAIQGDIVMIAFSGVSGGQAFSGQLQGSLSGEVYEGFFRIPGSGFLTVVFVHGVGSIGE